MKSINEIITTSAEDLLTEYAEADESLKPFINPDGTVRWLDHMLAMMNKQRQEVENK